MCHAATRADLLQLLGVGPLHDFLLSNTNSDGLLVVGGTELPVVIAPFPEPAAVVPAVEDAAALVQP